MLLGALALLAGTLLGGCSGSREDAINPSLDARRIYDKGTQALSVGNYDGAISAFEYLKSVYPFSEYAKQGQLDLMYAYYKHDEPESAVDAADNFLLENPTHPRVDYAHYIKGLANFERDRGPMERLFGVELSERPPKDLEASFRSFAVVANQYPDSIYAADARQRMVYIRNQLARYEIHVARYYMRRTAWVAAVNRSKYVLEHYPQTPSVVSALQVMVTAYDKLGLEELSANSMQVLRENYPDQAKAYGEPGTEVEGSLLERLIQRRSLR